MTNECLLIGLEVRWSSWHVSFPVVNVKYTGVRVIGKKVLKTERNQENVSNDADHEEVMRCVDAN